MVWVWIVLAIGFAAVELVMLRKYAAAISISSAVMALIYHITQNAGNKIGIKMQLLLFAVMLLTLTALVFVYNKFYKK